MSSTLDDALDQVSRLVSAAESAVSRLDSDPAAGWGMLATEQLEVVELLESLNHPPGTSPEAEPGAGSTPPPGVDVDDPAALYAAAAEAAGTIDPAETPPGVLPALVQALTTVAATARMVQRGQSTL